MPSRARQRFPDPPIWPGEGRIGAALEHQYVSVTPSRDQLVIRVPPDSEYAKSGSPPSPAMTCIIGSSLHSSCGWLRFPQGAIATTTLFATAAPRRTIFKLVADHSASSVAEDAARFREPGEEFVGRGPGGRSARWTKWLARGGGGSRHYAPSRTSGGTSGARAGVAPRR